MNYLFIYMWTSHKSQNLAANSYSVPVESDQVILGRNCMPPKYPVGSPWKHTGSIFSVAGASIE